MARALLVESGGELLAIPTDGARCEVVDCGPLTGLPGGAPLLLGLGVLGGRATPVVNLPHLLGQPGRAPGLAVVAELDGDRFALPIDAALGLHSLPEQRAGAEVLGAPLTLPAGDGRAEQPVRTLNPGALLGRVRQHLERL